MTRDFIIDALRLAHETDDEVIERALQIAYTTAVGRPGGMRVEAMSDEYWAAQQALYRERTGKGPMDREGT